MIDLHQNEHQTGKTTQTFYCPIKQTGIERERERERERAIL